MPEYFSGRAVEVQTLQKHCVDERLLFPAKGSSHPLCELLPLVPNITIVITLRIGILFGIYATTIQEFVDSTRLDFCQIHAFWF